MMRVENWTKVKVNGPEKGGKTTEGKFSDHHNEN